MGDPYSILGVAPGATQEQITKAFRVKALKLHPDKNPGDAKCAEAFRLVLEAVTTLREAAQKGETVKTTEADLLTELKAFEKSFIGSKEEEEELLALYTRFAGNMVKVMEYMMFSSLESMPRYRVIILKARAEERVRKYKSFQPSYIAAKAAQQAYKEEEKELKVESKAESVGALMENRPAARKRQFDNMIQSLEKKYSKLDDLD